MRDPTSVKIQRRNHLACGFVPSWLHHFAAGQVRRLESNGKAGMGEVGSAGNVLAGDQTGLARSTWQLAHGRRTVKVTLCQRLRHRALRRGARTVRGYIQGFGVGASQRGSQSSPGREGNTVMGGARPGRSLTVGSTRLGECPGQAHWTRGPAKERAEDFWSSALSLREPWRWWGYSVIQSWDDHFPC